MAALASIAPDLAAAVETAAGALVALPLAGYDYAAVRDDLCARFRRAAAADYPALAAAELDLLTMKFKAEMLARAREIAAHRMLAETPSEGRA